ncbi:MAG TPA: M28 family peptidase, partial [Acidobacteriota bacterium]|nr:M28 family peptidase [Acidobacteriota bacterium]
MKKPALMSFVAVFIALSLAAQVPAPAPAAKPDERVKNLDLVEKVAPAPDTFKAGLESISAKDSLAMLAYIASDLMEGRETGTRGYQAAAEYAASLFGLAHLKPLGDPGVRPFNMMQMMLAPPQGPAKPAEMTYLQEFPLIETVESSSALSFEARKGGSVLTHTFRPTVDYMGLTANGDTLSGPVVFVGYGISEKSAGFDEYKGIDVAGKIVLILTGSPEFLPKDIKAKYSATPGLAPPPPGGASPGAGPAPVRVDKLQELRKRGPAVILVVRAGGREADRYRALLPRKGVSDETPIINKTYRRMSLPGASEEAAAKGPAIVNLMSGAADRILGVAGLDIESLKKKIETTKRPVSQDIAGASVTMTSTLKTQVVRGINVVGVIEGADPELKKEAIVVGAHLDHEGRWEDYIYNGSDDNGSGSVGVLNLARAFAANPQKPKRTLVFALWCGEEEGLLGSEYFVKNPPRLLTAKIVSYLNFDMISRTYDE